MLVKPVKAGGIESVIGLVEPEDFSAGQGLLEFGHVTLLKFEVGIVHSKLLV